MASLTIVNSHPSSMCKGILLCAIINSTHLLPHAVCLFHNDSFHRDHKDQGPKEALSKSPVMTGKQKLVSSV